MINQTDIDKLYTKFRVKLMAQKDEKRAIGKITNDIKMAINSGLESMVISSKRGLGIDGMNQKDLESLAKKVSSWSSHSII